MIRQFVPSEFCLDECRGCCRFSHKKSIWSPGVLNEEIQLFLEDNISSLIICENKKIRLIRRGNIFICPFLNLQDNKCKIYPFRPFECQMYPFLINRRKEKIFLAVDLGCAFIKKNLPRTTVVRGLHTQEFKKYVRYLDEFFNNASELDRLRNNPQIVQTYEDALDLSELKFLMNETT